MSAPATTYTLDELVKLTGIVSPRLVTMWRGEKAIPSGDFEGGTLQMAMVEGERRWWIEGVAAPVHASADCKFEAVEETTEQEAEDALEEEAPETEITLAWLKDVEGIGDKAAQGVLDGCAGLGITTYADLAAVENMAQFEGIGKKNGAALREALADYQDVGSEIAEDPQDCDACGEPGKSCKISGVMCLTCMKDVSRIKTAYPTFVYTLDVDDTALAKTAVEAAMDPNKIPCVDGMSERCERLFLAWHKELSDSRIIPKKDSEDSFPGPEETFPEPPTLDEESLLKDEEVEYPIHCPHCAGLFDNAPAGFYPEEWAHCSSQDRKYGNCDQTFWIKPLADGYAVSITPPAKTPHPPEKSIDERLADQVEELDAMSQEWASETVQVEEPPAVPEDLFDMFFEPVLIDAPPAQAAYQSIPLEERVHPGLTHCRVLARTEAHSEDWHKARAMGIGSSDAGAILGLSPHADPADVWKTKTGEDTPRKPWLDDYSAFGTWFEPYIREWSEERMKVEVIDGATLGTLQSSIWDKALANIDGLDAYGVVEEYKTTTSKWTEVPVHYETQAQHQMFVTGATEVRMIQFVCPMDRALVPSLLEGMRSLAMFPDDADRLLANWLMEHGEFHTWIVERDDVFIERMLAQEKRFWEFVELGVIPPAEDPEGTVDLTDEPTVYAALEEFALLSSRCVAIKPVQKEADAAKKTAIEAITKALALLGEKPKRIVIGGHKATFVQKEKYSYWQIRTGEVGDDIPL